MKLRYLSIAVCAMSAIMFTGCNSDEPTPQKGADAIMMSRSECEMVQAQSNFALKLLKTVSEKKAGENVGFSPFCVQQALAMLGNGVSDADRGRYAETSGMTDIAEMNELNIRLNESLPIRDPEFVSVNIANGLWLNRNYKCNLQFAEIMDRCYAGETGIHDFGTTNIADIANKWIADKTANGVQNLLPQSYNRNNEIIFILANAMYFNGKWNTKFETSQTMPMDFTDSDGNPVGKVATMHNRQKLNYYAATNYALASLSFGRGMYRMLIILPDKGVKPADVLADLTDEELFNNLASAREYSADVYLPKFSICTNDNITADIINTGLPLNDFGYGNICDEITDISALHGFNMSVDEEGAVIKTATVISGMAGANASEPLSDLHIDRPFIFAVYEISSRAMLGLGIINNPVQ